MDWYLDMIYGVMDVSQLNMFMLEVLISFECLGNRMVLLQYVLDPAIGTYVA